MRGPETHVPMSVYLSGDMIMIIHILDDERDKTLPRIYGQIRAHAHK